MSFLTVKAKAVNDPKERLAGSMSREPAFVHVEPSVVGVSVDKGQRPPTVRRPVPQPAALEVTLTRRADR